MFEQIKSILEQYTGITDITEQSTLEDDLGLSSFDVVEIISELEDAFDIKIADRDIPKFVRVKDVVDYLKAHGKYE